MKLTLLIVLWLIVRGIGAIIVLERYNKDHKNRTETKGYIATFFIGLIPIYLLLYKAEGLCRRYEKWRDKRIFAKSQNNNVSRGR